MIETIAIGTALFGLFAHTVNSNGERKKRDEKGASEEDRVQDQANAIFDDAMTQFDDSDYKGFDYDRTLDVHHFSFVNRENQHFAAVGLVDDRVFKFVIYEADKSRTPIEFDDNGKPKYASAFGEELWQPV
ncbi:hypothetical protein LF1_14480 [Rubripirellula obstinata]|uniref:Uncharacterized protein n=1 Tax=Rubripirellula obstinata TaxID=406547 RepID=A0A5B1CI34_9BACT|nr:hypothetical protein [Rubripirellula obstinata]KAA1258924.1 hypothetical protein LF1_14480 [Rubripirellula obstinata]